MLALEYMNIHASICAFTRFKGTASPQILSTLLPIVMKTGNMRTGVF